MRKEVIGGCQLYLGDCQDILCQISSVDAIITDPPFEKEAHRSTCRTMNSIKTGIADSIDFECITENIRDFIAEWGVKNSKGWNLYFCQVEAVAAWRDSIEKAGGKYKRGMIWVKPDSSPQFNGQMPAQGFECIAAEWAGEGYSKWNGGGRRGVFTHCTNNADRHGVHPTEKPLDLMKELVSLFSNKEELVMDPFMGSGTTGVACVKLGRNFIGIERDEKYFDIACRRIEEAYKQPDLFIEPLSKPTQEKLL